jgi:hypothetical protein
MSIKTFKLRYGATFSVALHGKTWRDRLALALRMLADGIDGHYSARLDITTIPALSYEQKVQCIQYGLNAAGRCLLETAKAEALEQALRATHRELF